MAKRRHVIFVTASGLDYCRVSEGDRDFPRGEFNRETFERDPVADSFIASWADAWLRGMSAGMSYRIEVW